MMGQGTYLADDGLIKMQTSVVGGAYLPKAALPTAPQLS